MTQRVFDIENEKDMADLWDILPDWVFSIKRADKSYNYDSLFSKGAAFARDCCILKINWHDKTEITRPIQDATEQDIGKICVFYDRFCETGDEPNIYAVLHRIEQQSKKTWFYTDGGDYYEHCRRLTKQEIEELC